eukprot:Sspe_Gene.18216::Locus_6531_Transcript_1_1_Confidence_1.000_Length_1103::g.18216::m.18216
MGLEEEREAALALIWGGKTQRKGGKKRERGAGDDEDEVKTDQQSLVKKRRKKGKKDEEDVNAGLSDSDDDDDKPKKSRKRIAKERAISDEKNRTLHVHLDATCERNDVRRLFEDYDPKVTVHKYLNRKQPGKYALVVFKTKAMAEHAHERFNGTCQKDLLGTEKAQINFVRSRRASKHSRERSKKQKQKAYKAKVAAEKSARGSSSDDE